MHFTPSPITMLATDGTVSLNLLNVATLPVHSLSHLVYVGGCCLSTTSFSSIAFSIAFPLFSVILYIVINFITSAPNRRIFMLDITITEMENTFDHFLTIETFVRSGITYSFDGRINKDFYDKEELEAMASTSYTTWENLRTHVYNVIRGKKLPLSFKIVLVLSQPDIMDMLEKNHLTIPVSDVANLTLNIYYDGMSIQLTSMATQNIFTMDKTLELVWDAEIREFLKKAGICFTDN